MKLTSNFTPEERIMFAERMTTEQISQYIADLCADPPRSTSATKKEAR
jgi:hypothetical protein